MAFPEGFIYELKSRNDITEVISSYVALKRRGRNMVGLCPFHGEKTPSFNIYTETDSFYCFGCGASGDVISFIMKIENLDYVDAVKYLAQRVGLDMPEDSYDDSLSNLRRRVFEANREAARFFYRSLMSPEGKGGRDYLRGRMLTDATIRHFGLGYAPDKWTALCDHLKAKGFKENEIISANLGVKRHSGNGIIDRFRDRVMFPIIDLRGNVIAFGGRIMSDAKPKYLNSSDTPVFKKSENLFSLNNAKKLRLPHIDTLRGLYGRHRRQSGGLSKRRRLSRNGADLGAGGADETLRRRDHHLLRRGRGRTKGDCQSDSDSARGRSVGQSADCPGQQGSR